MGNPSIINPICWFIVNVILIIGRPPVACEDRRVGVCGVKHCKDCHKRSFASHDKSVHWSSKNKLHPSQVPLRSQKFYKFDCPTCPHLLKMQTDSVSFGQWCRFCCNSSARLCDKEGCDHCTPRSFASSKYAKYWSSENDLEPWQVSICSDIYRKFDCKGCGHEISQCPNAINRGVWCIYCAGKDLCKDKNCEWCYARSFAPNALAASWSDSNGDLKPWHVTRASGKVCDFDCKDCEQPFSVRLASVSCHGVGCPTCRNKTAKKLLLFLINEFGKKLIKAEAKFDWCQNPETNRFLPLDYCLEKFKLIIELDGLQHFMTTPHFRTTKEGALERDLYKTQQCIQNGYTIVRILQPDVHLNKNNWQERLLEHVRIHSKVRPILLDNKGEYEPLRKALKAAEEGDE